MPSLRDLVIGAATQEDKNGWGDILAAKSAAKQKQEAEIARRDSDIAKLLQVAKDNPELSDRGMHTDAFGYTGKAPDWQQQMRHEDKIDKRTQKISEQIKSEGIPETQSALRGYDRTKKDLGKAVGGALNWMPSQGSQAVAANIKSGLGEFFKIPSWQGAGEAMQEYNRLMNIDTRNFSGTAQSKYEIGRQEMEKGLKAGGTEEQAHRGAEMMREAMEENKRNIFAGAGPEATSQYKEQYEALGENISQPSSTKSSTIPMIHPKTGEIVDVVAEDEGVALQQGFKREK